MVYPLPEIDMNKCQSANQLNWVKLHISITSLAILLHEKQSNREHSSPNAGDLRTTTPPNIIKSPTENSWKATVLGWGWGVGWVCGMLGEGLTTVRPQKPRRGLAIYHLSLTPLKHIFLPSLLDASFLSSTLFILRPASQLVWQA